MILVLFFTLFILIFIQANFRQQSTFYTKNISNIINIPTISFSNSKFEARIRVYDDFSHILYPKQKRINYLDFVYEN